MTEDQSDLLRRAFASDDVVAAFEARGCRWETLAKIPSAEDEGYHVHVFQIYF